MTLSRRTFVIATPFALAGCAGADLHGATPAPPSLTLSPHYLAMYAAIDERFPIAAVDLANIDPKFYRQVVNYPTEEEVGTLVVDTSERHLYLVLEGGQALRYGVGVGKAGLEFEGVGTVQRKLEWPRWTPTPDMILREPDRYGPVAGGLEPGVNNPLGPRALYLFKDNRDTLYRIHGTKEDWSIGTAVSSGCVRMLNQDVIDLYNRVPDGSRVVVLQDAKSM